MKKKHIQLRTPLEFIPFIFCTIFLIVLGLLLFTNPTYHLKRSFIFSNIFVLIPFLITIFMFNKFYKDGKVRFRRNIVIFSLLILLFQILLIACIYFYSDWDVKAIRDLVNKFMQNRNLNNEFYLSIYPNNILLTSILVLIKCIPFIGKYYITTLIINAIIVNISGIFTVFALKNFLNEKLALISYIFMIPLIMLSPWITIPYTDTFALPFVSIIIYLYSKSNKNRVDYFLIGLTSILGYKIKPTVIIVSIAILIVEVFSITKKSKFKEIYKKCFLIFCGASLAFFAFNMSKICLKFKPINNLKPITYKHYLAMGQNDETVGAYSQKDVDETLKYGEQYDLQKFKKRVISRSLDETLKFYHKKTMLNFNDGSFSWGLDGAFFYKKVPVSSNFAKFLRQIYYNDGKYYNIFIQTNHYIWLIVLLLCPWMVRRKNSKFTLMIMLSIIGLTMFLTIFEPRTRYMYCFSPAFIIAANVGLCNLNNHIENFKDRINFKSKEVNNEK